MAFLFPTLLLVIGIAVFGTIMREGLWSNAITLVNVITASLIATNFWEPIASTLDEQVPSATFLWDLVVLWLLFTIVLLILRLCSDSVSKVRVRFKKPVELFGGLFLAGWVAWVSICFTAMTLHTAPLSREFLFGGFRAEERMMFGLAPDRRWLGFVQRMSLGPFSRVAPQDDPNAHVFDRHSEFMIKYAARRERYSKKVGLLLEDK